MITSMASGGAPPREPAPGEATRVAAGGLLALAAAGQPERAGPHLVVEEPGAGERIVPCRGALLIGRGREAGLRLRDPSASRRHAQVLLSSEGLAEVVDLGSWNGLQLGGRRLRTRVAALANGDVLSIGEVRLTYVDPLGPVIGEGVRMVMAPGAASPAGEAAPAPPGTALPLAAAALLLLAAALLAW